MHSTLNLASSGCEFHKFPVSREYSKREEEEYEIIKPENCKFQMSGRKFFSGIVYSDSLCTYVAHFCEDYEHRILKECAKKQIQVLRRRNKNDGSNVLIRLFLGFATVRRRPGQW